MVGCNVFGIWKKLKFVNRNLVLAKSEHCLNLPMHFSYAVKATSNNYVTIASSYFILLSKLHLTKLSSAALGLSIKLVCSSDFVVAQVGGQWYLLKCPLFVLFFFFDSFFCVPLIRRGGVNRKLRVRRLPYRLSMRVELWRGMNP